LKWLRQRRDDGYHIVGLEQTSSSESLQNYTFPYAATTSGAPHGTMGSGGMVLLLGKEKEGIPVEFLQAVDQCLEIPQYGIIRSLNVHVSAAIAIWEYTKQQQKCNALAQINDHIK
jgi:tRNA guanosine-2'-O-methyltransferase